MPVGELLDRMSARELDEWQAYARIEPFGEERKDLRMGVLASVIHNTSFGAKKAMKPTDFMPTFDQPVAIVAQTNEELAAAQVKSIFGVNPAKGD